MRNVTLFAAALSSLALTACGGYGHAGAGVAGAQATRVTATETEFKIALSRPSLTPGTYVFVAVNKGHVAHSLEIVGPGVSGKRIAGTIAPGQSKTLTATLRKGTYELYCPVDGHKRLGMDVKIAVGPAATSPPLTTTTETGVTGGGYGTGGGGY